MTSVFSELVCVKENNTMVISLNEQLFRRSFPKITRYLVYNRFMRHVTIGEEDECWEWQASCVGGYGSLPWNEKGVNGAHIVSYLLFVGTIPKRKGKKKLCVCHKCDNPPCCNPNHLFLGTRKQNAEDMVKKHRHHRCDGEFSSQAKLTLEEVNKIKKLYETGNVSKAELGRKFNVTRQQIYNITVGKSWVQ
jgi:hypothetical protein